MSDARFFCVFRLVALHERYWRNQTLRSSISGREEYDERYPAHAHENSIGRGPAG